MARVPLTKETVETDRLVLNLNSVGLSEEQFFRLCRHNDNLRFELSARKELIIMSPAKPKTSWRNNLICYRLTEWALRDGTGLVFESSAGYTLPNGAIRAPACPAPQRSASLKRSETGEKISAASKNNSPPGDSS
jgi:Uma2 family endonuclease